MYAGVKLKILDVTRLDPATTDLILYIKENLNKIAVRKEKLKKLTLYVSMGYWVGDRVDYKNRIEVKCETSPVPFYELVGSRIVKIKINPVKNSNGSHTAGISMITERNSNFYEVKSPLGSKDTLIKTSPFV